MILLNLKFKMSKSKNFYNAVVQKDAVLCLNIKKINYYKIKKLKTNIQISFKPQLFKHKKIVFFMLLLEIIGKQKPIFFYSKKDVSLWRLRKKEIVGIGITLRSQNNWFFLDKFLMQILPMFNNKGVTGKSYSQILLFYLKNNFFFYELEKEILYSSSISEVAKLFETNFTFSFQKPLNKKEFLFFKNSFQLNI